MSSSFVKVVLYLVVVVEIHRHEMRQNSGECIRIPDFQRFNWKCRQYPTINFSPFKCCLSVVLSLDKGAYPGNSQVALCHIK